MEAWTNGFCKLNSAVLWENVEKRRYDVPGSIEVKAAIEQAAQAEGIEPFVIRVNCVGPAGG